MRKKNCCCKESRHDPQRNLVQEELEPTIAPPGIARSTWIKLADGTVVASLPSKNAAVSMYDPSLWTWMTPENFVYGDGIWGIQRPQQKLHLRMTFREWACCLLDRDDLEYDGGINWSAPDFSASPSHPVRWEPMSNDDPDANASNRKVTSGGVLV